MRSDPILIQIPLLVVIGVAFTACAQRYELHRREYAANWVGLGHDRNAHYRYGLQLAADATNGDVHRFLIDFDAGSWVWPPLNGILVAAVALLAGPNPVTAALPALLGWFLSMVFAFALASRSAGRFGVPAGFLAAACVLVSPAHRAYATDVMLESLGAGLTLMALHAFVVWSQVRTPRAGAWLGFALSLLFFQKFNYWLLVAFTIFAAHGIEQRAEYWHLLKRLRRDVPWRIWFVGQWRRPLNYPIAMLLAVVAVFAIAGAFTIELFGQSLAVESNQIFVAVAFALALLRFTIWWWTGGRHTARAWLLPEVYPLLYWHAFPVLIWLVIPYRLRTFIWFVSPANSEKEYHSTFSEGARFYLAGIEGEYVASPEVYPILAIGVLASIALMAVPRSYRPSGWAVPLFAVVALLLTFKHPNHKLRFLHTGTIGAYVAAAIGFAGLSGTVCRIAEIKVGDSWNRALRYGCYGLLTFAAMTLIAWAGRDLERAGHASEAGLNGRGTSLRPLTETVAALLPAGEPVAVFSSGPSKFWAMGMYLERSPRHELLQVDCRQVGVLTSPTAQQFEAWCAKTDCRSVIFIEIPTGSPLYDAAPPEETAATIRGFLPTSTYRLVQTIEHADGATITVWRR